MKTSFTFLVKLANMPVRCNGRKTSNGHKNNDIILHIYLYLSFL